MKKVFLLALFGVLVCFSFSNAMSDGEVKEKLKPFRNVKEVTETHLEFPKVVEVFFNDEKIERNDFAILENETNTFQPYYFKVEDVFFVESVDLLSSHNFGETSNLMDDDLGTYVEYSLPKNGKGKATIDIVGQKEFALSSFRLILDRNVRLPEYVEVRVLGDEERVILAKSRMYGTIVNFPKTTAKTWQISFDYEQMFRINELKLYKEDVQRVNKSLRFLARPNKTYKIYFNSDTESDIFIGEVGDLVSDKDILAVSVNEKKDNPFYIKSDIDGDGIADDIDNCKEVANQDQLDEDGSGYGDVCDDFDRDGIININDNCPEHPNYNQADEDGDKIGDVCDDEESRLTEKMPWIIWVSMVLVVFIAGGLLVITIRK